MLRARNKVGYVLPILIIVAVLLCGFLSACSTSSKGRTANPATCGRSVFLHESNVLFFGYDSYLCSATVDKKGNVSEFTVEATMSSDIKYVAVDSGSLFVANNDGIFAFDLSEFTNNKGTAQSTQLSDKTLYSGFEIWDGYLYYLSGGSLYRVPVGGGESVKLHNKIYDFDIYGGTIYFTTTDKGLYEMPIEGEGVCLASVDGVECSIAVSDKYIYTLDYRSTTINRYSFESKDYTEVEVSPTSQKNGVIFAHDDILLYKSAGAQVCVANTQDGLVKAPVGEQNFLVYKSSSSLVDNKMYTFDPYAHNLTVYDFDTNEAVKYAVEDELAGMLAKAQQGSSASSGSSSSSSNSTSGSSASLGISDDWSTVTGYAWKATLPDEWKGLVSAKTANGGKNMIFYVSDQEAKGFGGTLVSLIYSNEANPSYPKYEQLHSYGDGNYLYAVYPTDVQYDTSNPGQYPTCQDAIPTFLKSITY